MSALFYVGAYSEALVAAELDTERGEMREVYRADGAHRATVLALNQARTHLYAGHEYFPGSGGVSAWKLDDAGCPRQLNYLPAHGEGPCHVALVDGGQYLMSAGYYDGKLMLFPIAADGALAPACSEVQLHGSGPVLHDPPRAMGQNQARAHFVLPMAGTPYILCADYGSDKVRLFVIENGAPKEHSALLLPPGSGPQHLCMHGAHVYAVCELNSTMAALRFDMAAGVLEAMQIRSTLPEGYTGFSEAVDVCIPRGGRHLYTLNRGQDSIAVFPLLASGAPLGAPSHVAEGVKLPRSLAADPSGQFLLVCNEHADEVALYSLCPEDGLPVFTGVVLPAEKPAGICFYEGDL
ncbi:lactonase family protein [Ruminococcaceae bacterium OttesenSCG-928-D13]|nr:lactonase family protein [Ruminococcaceae bacterium OttesenSCG-928-D13]